MTRFKHGWKPDLPDGRDKLYKAIRPSNFAIPTRIDLSSCCPPVFDQQQLGSCTANALAGVTAFLDIKEQIPLCERSRLFIYYNERAIEGDIDQDNGAQIRDGIKSLAKLGVCPETTWPYNVGAFNTPPPPEAFKEAALRRIKAYHRLLTLDDMISCLADGFPFAFGFTVYEGFESAQVAKDGIVSMPEPGERVVGGHAVYAIGYDQIDETFLVRNSWGESWGKNGNFTIPFDYLRTMADDFWRVSH